MSPTLGSLLVPRSGPAKPPATWKLQGTEASPCSYWASLGSGATRADGQRFLGTSSRNAPPIHGSTRSSTRGSPSQPWRQVFARPCLCSGVHWAVQRHRRPRCPVDVLEEISSKPGLSCGRSVSGGEGCLLQLHAISPRTRTRTRTPRGPVLSCSQCFRRLGGNRLLLRTVCRPGPGRALPPLPASQRARAQGQAACGPTALRFLSATRPAAAPSLAARPAAGHWSAVLFYIGRPGPIGVQHLLNMHAGHQSASAGAGPPRAVAKLGLLNCY